MPRVLVALLLALAGALGVAAAVDRWWSSCGLGGFDAPACLAAQDHARDADRALVALLALAAALLLLPLLGERRSTASGVAAGLLAASLLVPGGVWVQLLAWPPALAVALAGVRRRWVLVALLSAATPLGAVLLAPSLTGYASYDTTPWSEAVPGVTLLAAAAAMSLVGGRGPEHHDDHPPPRDAVGHAGLRRPRPAAHR